MNGSNMPPTRAYLDTNVFLIGINKIDSNSRLILEAAKAGKFLILSSFHVINEVDSWFRQNKTREDAFKALGIIGILTSEIIQHEEIKNLLPIYKNKAPEDDLPHLCAAKALNADLLVSTNIHFLKEQNIIKTLTPKEFVKGVLNLNKYFESDG
ncbi:MAG: PIN domain-containing protein [Candidatus Aenigmarchaeota archaeon]|nr:PIN domain-containing protein [Candidatus Aenigmarchaeota archaeon]